MNRLLFVLLFIFTSLNTFANSKQGFFFFGDSLSDTGYQNNNPDVKQAGKTPQWTSPQGHTWVYYFLKNQAHNVPRPKLPLKPNNVDAATFFHPVPNHITPILDGNNFAAGGSTTGGKGMINTKDYKSPSLLQQTDYFLSIYAQKHSVTISNNEYLIWSGSNDLMKKLAIEIWIAGLLQKTHLSTLAAALHCFNVQKLPPRFANTEATIAKNLRTAVLKLESAGAKKIVVVLVPDIGVIPLIGDLVQGLQKKGSSLTSAELSTQMRTVTDATNARIRSALTGTHAILVDPNTLMRPLTQLSVPAYFQETKQQFGQTRKFLIVNDQNPACPPPKMALTCIPTVKNAKHYVFEDLVHPTDQTHQILGDYIYYQSELLFNS